MGQLNALDRRARRRGVVERARASTMSTIRLGGRDILAAASFAIEDGEFVGMLGANGAGKTTLMRAALGLAARRFGRRSARSAGRRRAATPQIGYMPQNRGAIAGSAAERAGTSSPRRRSARASASSRLDKATRREIDWALDQVGARDLARRSIGELSGGERQRLLLARRCSASPRLLLLDEPLISLDPAPSEERGRDRAALSDDLEVAILFSAHELNPLVNAIDRVLYLGGGEAALGTVDEVITGPVLSRLYGAEIEVVRVGGPHLRHGRATSTSSATPHRHDHHAARTPMLDYDFMRTAFAAGGIAAVARGHGRVFPGAARPDLRRPCAVACRLHRRDRRRSCSASRRSSGLVGFTFVAGHRHGAVRASSSPSATSRSAWCCRWRSASGCCSCISTPPSATQATALLFGNVLGVDSSRAPDAWPCSPSSSLAALGAIIAAAALR